MNRYSLMMLATAMVLATALVGSTLHAQTAQTAQTAPTAPPANPLSAEVKGSYTGIKNNFVKAAEKMPEEHYGFKATAEVQTFGQRVAHIADANLRTCALLKGEQKSGNAASKTSKADLVAALKESFAYCDSIYDSLTDADATKLVTMGNRQRSKLAALWGIVAHDNEVYGAMGVYMRLKGIVPPSSEGR
jgi:uncharacterized damage-inducible protein DinB